MRIGLEQMLPAPPAAVWPFLTDPARMNRWSLAGVTSISLGEGQDPGGVGALRKIAISALGRNVAFEEVVVHAEPPDRFVYRVVRGLPLRHHQGEITLQAEREATRLRWEVEFEFVVPGVDRGLKRLLNGQLRKSVEGLARVVRGAPEVEIAPRSFVDDLAELTELECAAECILAEQRALADRLGAARDPKYWFARVYQYVTESQIAFCREGRLTHKAWVMRLIPRFHAYYMDNLRRFLGELPGAAESHWQVAFRAMDRARPGRRDAGMQTVKGLLYGVAAHIEDDLPRALAEVYRRHYAGRCDFVRFRADYLLMAGIFHRASARLVEQMPSDFFPLYMRLLGPALPIETKDALNRRYYDVARKRRQAFERGGRLAVWPG